MRLSNIVWIVQLLVIVCAIGILGQPMSGGKNEKLADGHRPKAAVETRMERSDREAAQYVNSMVAQVAMQPGAGQSNFNGAPVLAGPLQDTMAAPYGSYQGSSGQQQPQQLQSQVMGYGPGLRSRLPDISTEMAEVDEDEQRHRDLRTLVQHLYVAQARVQLEASEIKKAQAVATSTQTQLEDAANHVRIITASLHTAQQEVAASAIRAQIAQLQLAAHDQLLFAARQDVDALSSQMVGLQAAEGIITPKVTVDLRALLDKLRQPLQHVDRPTPVPDILAGNQRIEMENQRMQAQNQLQHQLQLPQMPQKPQQQQPQPQQFGQQRLPEAQDTGYGTGGSPSDFIRPPRKERLSELV